MPFRKLLMRRTPGPGLSRGLSLVLVEIRRAHASGHLIKGSLYLSNSSWIVLERARHAEGRGMISVRLRQDLWPALG